MYAWHRESGGQALESRKKHPYVEPSSGAASRSKERLRANFVTALDAGLTTTEAIAEDIFSQLSGSAQGGRRRRHRTSSRL
ncbi:MAG: hypothetical protein MHM6MM_000429 [Cercozoa sp. M6MM]